MSYTFLSLLCVSVKYMCKLVHSDTLSFHVVIWGKVDLNTLISVQFRVANISSCQVVSSHGTEESINRICCNSLSFIMQILQVMYYITHFLVNIRSLADMVQYPENN